MRRLRVGDSDVLEAVGAQAADMPDLPILRGSFTEGLSSTHVNWQGFYVGGQAAYGSSDENFSRLDSNMLEACSTTSSSSRWGSRRWNFAWARQTAPRRATAPSPATTGSGTMSSSASKRTRCTALFGGASVATQASTAAPRCPTASSTRPRQLVGFDRDLGHGDLPRPRGYAVGMLPALRVRRRSRSAMPTSRAPSLCIDLGEPAICRALQSLAPLLANEVAAQSPDLRLYRRPRRRHQPGRRPVPARRMGISSASRRQSIPASIPCAPVSATSSDAVGRTPRLDIIARLFGWRLRLLEVRIAMKIYGDSNSGNCLKVKWVVRQSRASPISGSPSTP